MLSPKFNPFSPFSDGEASNGLELRKDQYSLSLVLFLDSLTSAIFFLIVVDTKK